ncbi:hypothetical protein R3P38DRAFT_2880328 [Favolaschia claudopus]|uniref:SAM domain-containing protein n=1 Tax=Favolaschia claudopus TaxID=2862362 RepID=A0AAW0CXC7_9AGAR
MPGVTREQPGGVGGAGGYGEGIQFSAPLVSLDNPSKDKIPEITLANFCSKYHIDDDTRALLAENGFDPINTLFEIDEALLINDLNFRVGQIAELRWALRKMLAKELPNITSTNSRDLSTTSIHGGRGGDGGIGFQRGGEGGTGKPPKISSQDVFRFKEIASGIGGAGGASELPPLDVVKIMQITAGSRSSGGTILRGGQGGPGGWGSNAGGAGGVGGPSRIPAATVSLFAEINGGTGGGGGFSKVDGGRGGNGEGPDVPSHLVFIDDTTRRRIPHKTLAELGLNAPLRQLLERNGFRTAGGLFEAYDSYFPPDQFKMGQVALIKSTLKRKFSIT